MHGWTRWFLAGLGVLSGAACGRSTTAPSPPPALQVRTATLDFEALPHPSPPTDGMVRHGCTYAEDDYILENVRFNCSTPGGFVSVHMPPNPPSPLVIDRYLGSVSFSNGAWFGVTRLTRAGGGPFTLVSIDLDTFNTSDWPAPAPPDWSVPQTVTFTGTRADGTTVTQSFTTDSTIRRAETFAFRADFADVTSVEWPQLSPSFHHFDNVVVSSR